MDVNVFPSRVYFHVYLDKRNYPNWLHRSKLVVQRHAFINIFGRRNENLCTEVIPPWKFNNYGWTGYEEFVEYVEIRRMGGGSILLVFDGGIRRGKKRAGP